MAKKREDMGLATIYFDLTTLAHIKGPVTGTSRVESSFARCLARQYPGRVVYTAWISRRQQFVAFDKATLDQCDLSALEEDSSLDPLFPELKLDQAEKRENNILLVVGNSWFQNTRYLGLLLEYVKTNQLKFAALVHDIMFLQYPEWGSVAEVNRFRANFETVMQTADVLLHYSENVRSDVQWYCQKEQLPTPDLAKIKLGDDVPGAGAAASQLEEDHHLRRFFAEKEYVLYVSSFTVRKNHQMLVNIWSRLLKQYGREIPHLVFVGRVFPDQQETVERLRRTGGTREHLHILEDISDRELSWLYSNALFTCFPSLYEGWGIPVAESMRYGKFCIAADAGAVPEVSRGKLDLLDPLDFTAWYNRFATYINDRSLLAQKEAIIATEYQPRSWSDATESIIQTVSESPLNSRTPARSTFDTWPVQDDEGFKTLFRSGWHADEEDGSYHLVRPGGRLTITLPSGLQRPIRIQIGYHCNADAAASRDVLSISTGDTVLEQRRLNSLNQGQGTLQFHISPRLLHHSIRADLAFSISADPAAEHQPHAETIDLRSFSIRSLQYREISDQEEQARRESLAMTIPYHHDVPIDDESESDRFLSHGWSSPAPWGVWSSGDRATIGFKLPYTPVRGFNLRLRFRVFITESFPEQTIRVLVNSTHLETWKFDHQNRRAYYQRDTWVPVDLLDGKNDVNVSFEIDDPVSPAVLGMGQDTRELGIGLAQIRISDDD